MSFGELNSEQIIRLLLGRGKGILAVDESTGTIAKRFAQVDLISTERTRRDYREILFRTPGLDRHIGGVILFSETLEQTASDGTPLIQLLEDCGIVPGVKVDGGLRPLALGKAGEKITEGLDGLRTRLRTYRGLGALFTKWRVVYRIGRGCPSGAALATNAHTLAQYAALSQESGMVPIVEPEVLMEGDHDIELCAKVSETVLLSVFSALRCHGVRLERVLLKTNMILPGEQHETASPQDVAASSLRVFRRAVPASVPGILFLSGGQTSHMATSNLRALHTASGSKPWTLSFSFGRALQNEALRAWKGSPENAPTVMEALRRQAQANGEAISASAVSGFGGA